MNKTLFPALVFGASLFFVLGTQAQTEVPPTPRVDAFSPVAKLLGENNLQEAAAQLKTMKADGLKPDQFARWETLAARVALRLGDKKWLAAINAEAGLSTGADELVTLSALRLLLANRLPEARSTLEGIKKPYEMSEIPKRRYEQLYLKLEQLEGNTKAEAKWAGKLVEFVAGWDGANCQSCHANPRAHGKETTQFDLNHWWVGERYVQLIKASGEAGEIEKAARLALQKDAKDEAALIKLGYALRAQNQGEASEKTLRQIPWSRWSDRELKKPLRLGQFP